MPNLVVRTKDGRELQITRNDFIYLKDKEGEVNWEWQYIDIIHPQIEDLLNRSEQFVDEVKKLLPDKPMGRLK